MPNLRWIIRWCGLAMAASLWLVANPVGAQSALLPPASSIPLNRYQAVRDRAVPGYVAPGVPVGSFTLLPSVDAGLNYTDNVFAVQNNRSDDVFLRVSPTAQVRSNWADRSLTLTATGVFDRFANHASENVNAVHLSGDGAQQLGSEMELRLNGHFDADRESRESQNTFTLTDRPVRYSDWSTAVGLSKRFSAIMLDGQAGIQSLNYHDAVLRSGGILDQDYRDGTVKQLRGRVEVLQTPALAYFGQVTYSKTSYDDRTFLGFRRGGDRVEALGGVRFELPVLARGEIGVGYVNSSYRDGRFRQFAGLAVDARVTLFPTQLTTVLVEAQRSVNDAGTPNASTYVVTSGRIHVDHELLRTLVLGVETSYERDRFNGLDRRDRRWGVGATADWRLNRNLTLRASVDRLDLRSSGTARYQTFQRDRAMVGINVRI